jgi:hypothetical protein
MTFGRWLLALALIAAPGLAQAQEPEQEGVGCSGFKWPLESERAALVQANKPSLANGGALPYGAATILKLVPLADAGLPKAPEREPKAPQTFAGHFVLAAPAKPGVYKITLSSRAWVDVIDGGGYLPSRAFSYATACEGARKSVKFDLPDRPLALQFSGAPQDQISVIVSPESDSP